MGNDLYILLVKNNMVLDTYELPNQAFIMPGTSRSNDKFEEVLFDAANAVLQEESATNELFSLHNYKVTDLRGLSKFLRDILYDLDERGVSDATVLFGIGEQVGAVDYIIENNISDTSVVIGVSWGLGMRDEVVYRGLSEQEIVKTKRIEGERAKKSKEYWRRQEKEGKGTPIFLDPDKDLIEQVKEVYEEESHNKKIKDVN